MDRFIHIYLFVPWHGMAIQNNQRQHAQLITCSTQINLLFTCLSKMDSFSERVGVVDVEMCRPFGVGQNKNRGQLSSSKGSVDIDMK